MGKNRATKDPSTRLPESLQDELGVRSKRSRSSRERKPLTRKEKRKLRREKVFVVKEEKDDGMKRRTPGVGKKVKKTEPVKDAKIDPDRTEIEYYEKMLRKSSKRKRTENGSFDYRSEFRNQEDGLGYLLGAVMSDVEGSEDEAVGGPEDSTDDDVVNERGERDEEGEKDSPLEEKNAVVESQDQLVKKLRGLINRATDVNASRIAAQIVELLSGSDRDTASEWFADAIVASMKSCSAGLGAGVSPYLETYAGIVLYLGCKFAVHCAGLVIHRVALAFLSELQNESDAAGHFAVFLCELFKVRVTTCHLIFSVIRTLLGRTRERDIEILLYVLRRAGSDIRAEDPASLKAIVEMVQERSADKTKHSDDRPNSARFDTMLQLIMDIKNNRLRKNRPDNPERPWWRDIQVPDGAFPLEATLDLIERSEHQSTPWWEIRDMNVLDNDDRDEASSLPGAPPPDLDSLAASFRLNTSFRRSVFSLLMQSTDVTDATHRITSLNLRQGRDRDVIRVILHSFLRERTYNAFYPTLLTTLARSSKTFHLSITYAIWDQLKSSDTSSLSPHLAKLLTHLLNSNAFDLRLLRGADHLLLNPTSSQLTFFRQIFSNLTQLPNSPLQVLSSPTEPFQLTLLNFLHSYFPDLHNYVVTK